MDVHSAVCGTSPRTAFDVHCPFSIVQLGGCAVTLVAGPIFDQQDFTNEITKPSFWKRDRKYVFINCSNSEIHELTQSMSVGYQVKQNLKSS